MLLFCGRVRDPAIRGPQIGPYNSPLVGRLVGSCWSGKFRLLAEYDLLVTYTDEGHFAQVMTTGFCACVLSCLPTDSLLDGKEEITNDLLKRGAQGAYAAELFYYCNQLCLKFSILAFYWRVFSSSEFMRRSGYYLGGAIVLWFIASVSSLLLSSLISMTY